MAVLNWNLWFPTSSPTVDDNRPTTSPAIIGCLAQKPLNSSWCVTTISLRECVRALSRSAWRTHVSGLESSIWLTCGWITIASLIVYVRRFFFFLPSQSASRSGVRRKVPKKKNEITKYLQSFSRDSKIDGKNWYFSSERSAAAAWWWTRFVWYSFLLVYHPVLHVKYLWCAHGWIRT